MISTPKRSCAAVATIAVASIMSTASPALCHEPGLSSSIVRLTARAIEVSTTFSDADLRGRRGGSASAPSALPTLRLRAGQHAADLVEVDPLLVEVDHTGVRRVYERPAGETMALRLDSFAGLPHGHKHYVRVVDRGGREIAARILGATAPGFVIEPAAVDGAISGAAVLAAGAGGRVAPALRSNASGMLALGFEHILTGYDHLLFLLALLIGCHSLGAALRLMTVFTVAHSITLAGAVLGWLYVPPAVVEPAIAVSIIYAAVINLTAEGERTEAVAVTFAFGLVHGLGFAGALADLGIGHAAGAVKPLLLFNVGVEAGQAAVVALLLPIIVTMRRWPGLARSGAVVCSLAIAVVGTYWLLERTLPG